MNKLTITRTNGNVPKTLDGEDYISGFIAYMTSAEIPASFQDEPVQAVSTIDAAEALGITSDAEAWTIRALHYHLSEIFRINSGISLYLGIFQRPENHDFSAIKTVQNYAGGSIRQIAVWWSDNELDEDDVQAMQDTADALDDENAPLSVLYAPKVSDVAALRNSQIAGSDRCRVSVVIGQAGSGTAAELYEDEDNEAKASVSCVGTILGLLSNASVHQSIGWVKNFPTGISLPAFGDGTLYRDLDKAIVEALDDARFLFLVTYVGVAGTFVNDSHNMDSAISDYSTIESVRVMDKAVRGVRTYLTPELGGNVYIDADTGQLQSYSAEHLETTAAIPLEQMQKDNEISGYSVSIDRNQDVLTTSTLEVVIEIVAVGVVRKIKVKIGFTTSLS